MPPFSASKLLHISALFFSSSHFSSCLSSSPLPSLFYTFSFPKWPVRNLAACSLFSLGWQEVAYFFSTPLHDADVLLLVDSSLSIAPHTASEVSKHEGHCFNGKGLSRLLLAFLDGAEPQGFDNIYCPLSTPVSRGKREEDREAFGVPFFIHTKIYCTKTTIHYKEKRKKLIHHTCKHKPLLLCK